MQKQNAFRGALAALLCLGLQACATPEPAAQASGPAADIVEVASGRRISRDELLQRMRRSDFVLLGEQHDNPDHHRARGALLRELGQPARVVAEHLPSPAELRLKPGDELLSELSQAGFAAKQWQWPMHQPLFTGLAQADQVLLGGNIPLELARRLAREGRPAMPAELLALSDPAPLGSSSQARLEADLIQGHCGQLPGSRLAGMVWAQRGRDAAMALRMLQAAEQGAKPAVLLAGNGHVRLDYGVPQLLAEQQRQSRLLSIGFVEPGAPTAGAPYHYLWISPAPRREDPCAGFTMPAKPK
ncbi:putative iron-regulated protein [Paucibacter oligotrophus]|uniref:Putative iron-regulated protein n=1 Tax=Roseateles oligotrophus TaxID=1769250 RepID=A0A840LC07_9BURK|nr:ChaN family lipoprotein [Roseateles oligotrophus]MBB4844182.1 putative iron-regulated protein [Roseateles oligotrophus]